MKDRALRLALLGFAISGCSPDELSSDCIDGFEWDYGTGTCVIICDEGFRPNEDGTECVSACADGYEWLDGACIIICDASSERIDGACYPLCAENEVRDGTDCVCAEGFELIDEVCVPECAEGEERLDGVCVPPCPEGEERLDGVCVPECAENEERVDGVCIPNCAENEERIDGVCVPLCAEGYVRDELGVCRIQCPEGYAPNAAGDGCDRVCPPGYVVDGDDCLQVCDPGFELVVDECLPICADGWVRVDGVCVETGAVAGQMCDLATGTWMQGLTVSVTLEDGTVVSAVTNAMGAFELVDVPPGVYYVHIEGPTYSTDIATQVVSGQQTIIGYSQCEPPPGHLRGAVCDSESGIWVSGATVTLDDPAGTVTTTDQFGMFIFLSVPPGSYTLTIEYPDGTQESRPATVASNQITDLGPDTCEPPLDPCDGAHPTAVAGVDQTAVPDQTVTVSGTGSSDPTGQSLTYQWRIASQPFGSTASLSNPNAASPSLLTDVSGDFVVCLTVRDTDQCLSTEDCMQVHVAPQVALHIELVWFQNFSDIDLHLLKPGGTWGASCLSGGDMYFGCRVQGVDWGPSGPDGLTTNNPRLDVDNQAGYGPENINMDSLFDGGPFKIGVHYWTSTGAGNVTARVRVFVGGVQQMEATRTLTAVRQMWSVANLTVSGSATAVNIQMIDTMGTW